ncbi:putative N-acetyltransferase YkwB [Paenibacillus sp. J31TS4]|uniref:GNAT family N-acetyltransferase n=1 Tax=Paenibacillus sp. J31TS4 TaxID=2807195 RepID=UPI001AFDEE54|nr:GNAT family N-acetyltransferase [Paenibacillus sp. J31TS4]GIP39358.1 putative N-acetyltransferase YkwB [Paenibacillus sp. J31TS4]
MYRKEIVLPAPGGNRRAVIRGYGADDFAELIRIQQESFPPPFPPELWWNEEQLGSHIALFPEGALCIEVDGVLAGSMTGLLVRFDPARPEHTWAEVTDDGYIRTHDPDGDTLYVVDICIRPAYRKLDLGRWLMQAMYELVVHKGLVRLLGGGRMPGYHRYAGELSPERYVEAVERGELRDPVLTFLLRCGRTPTAVVEGYLDDEESLNYAALMEWRNPFLSHPRPEEA